MTWLRRQRFTWAGIAIGATVAAVGLLWFEICGYSSPLPQFRYAAYYLGFELLNPFYGCFPTDVSKFWTNTVLLASGAVQWGLIGFLVDLLLSIIRRRALHVVSVPEVARKSE